ncbi:MAG: Thermophilic serine proteinase precursor [Bacteroidetes bacterium ADurb.Bin408]|nr:MAG: Thermophilic serine proteinase precursor [Bacteroidetes bacterium ADurb.Bin408]
MKRIVFILVIVLSFNNSFSQKVFNDFWDGIVYIKIKPSAAVEIKGKNSVQEEFFGLHTINGFKDLAEAYGFTSVEKTFRTPALSNIYKITFNKADAVDRLIKSLQSLPEILYACKSPIYRSLFTPNDVHANQWYMNLIQAYQAWDITQGKSYVKVAIVDDAVKISHPDLASIIWNNPLDTVDGIDNDGNGFVDDIHGWDVANNDNDPEPPASHWMYQFSDMIFTHGTHCAGIAGAATNNGVGIASIGNGISIIPVKCTADNSILPLAIDEGPAGIDYAIAASADVISLSWGSGQNDSVVRDAVNAALAAGIIVTAAAGNDGSQTLFYPASLDGVISVGAITKNDIIASFSQRNNKVTLMAPGDSIWSCQRKNNSYMYLEGTSMACPMVAGLCGLLKSYDTTLTNEQIKACLIAGCDNIDSLNPSVAGLMGAGRINVYKSLLCLQNLSAENINKDEEALNIFPNPASDALYISCGKFSAKTINIIDMMGRTVIRINTETASGLIKVNTSGLSEGIYMLHLISSKGTSCQRKFIVQ